MSRTSMEADEGDALLDTSLPIASSSRTYSTLNNANRRERGHLEADKEKRNGTKRPRAPERSKSLAEELGNKGISLYEKKCLLVNREIDLMGMGRYQWSIWALCGAGYMIDLMGTSLWPRLIAHSARARIWS
jgi:hypothetical protein